MGSFARVATSGSPAERIELRVVVRAGLAERLEIQPARREQRGAVDELRLRRIADLQVPDVEVELLCLARSVIRPVGPGHVIRVGPIADRRRRVEMQEGRGLIGQFELDALVDGVEFMIGGMSREASSRRIVVCSMSESG